MKNFDFWQRIKQALKMSVVEMMTIDTTVIEYMSASAGIAMGVGLFTGWVEPFMWYKPVEFWAMVITILSVLQLSSVLLFTNKVAMLRIVTSLIAAASWL